MTRRTSLASAIKTVQQAGLTIRAIETFGDDGYRILTEAPQEELSELDRAREARRARKAAGAAHGH